MRIRALVVMAGLAICQPAWSQSIEEAREAYIAGDYETARALAAPLAEQGDGLALNLMAVLYREGAGVPQDMARAVELSQAAIHAGEPRAMVNMAAWMVLGLPEVPRNERRARELVQRAYEMGYLGAANLLGTFYENGTGGLTADPVRAFELYQIAHDNGWLEATTNLALLHAKGVGTEEDFGAALALFEQAAEQGEERALYNLWVMYNNGYGVRQDEKRAFSFLNRAAELGDAAALNTLGTYYHTGFEGQDADLGTAAKLYERAADAGSGTAALNLAYLYLFGDGVPADDGRAFALFEQAHAAGEPDATRELASLLRDGRGVAGPDPVRARDLLMRLQASDDPVALNDLGTMWQTGEGGPKDLAKALRFYKRAMALGYDLAALNAGDVMLDETFSGHNPVMGLAHCFLSIGMAETPEYAQENNETCTEWASALSLEQQEAARGLADVMSQ